MSKSKQEQEIPPSIVGIAQATGYLAGFLGDDQDDDRLLPVVAWTVMRSPEAHEPDEVVGQVWQGEYLTEAPAIEDEEGDYKHVGYFTDDKEGRSNFVNVCKAMRGEIDAGIGDEDDDDDEEDEDEDEDDIDLDEDDDEDDDDDEDEDDDDEDEDD